MSRLKLNAERITMLLFWIPGLAAGLFFAFAPWADGKYREAGGGNDWGLLLALFLVGFILVSGIPTLIWMVLKIREWYKDRKADGVGIQKATDSRKDAEAQRFERSE